MRILAVDDDPIILNLLDVSLRQCGHDDLTFVSSGEEALAYIKDAHQPYDILLLDIMMPGIDGIELCSRIRAQKAYRATPIIMITTSRETDVMTRAFDAGATDFVTKPFEGLQLGTRIKLAGLLSESLRLERQARHELTELSRVTAIAFGESFSVEGKFAIKDMDTFQAELLRRPDTLYAMRLITAQVIDANYIYRTSAPAQYRKMIELIGDALAGTTDLERTTLAHVGGGRFAIACFGRARPDLGAMSSAIEAALYENWPEEETGLAAAPRLELSSVSSRGLWTGPSAINAFSDALSVSGKSAKGVQPAKRVETA